MAGDGVDRATCWALTSPGCGWCVGALGDRCRAPGPPHQHQHHHLHTSDSHGLRLTSASHRHLRTDTQILVFQLADTFVCVCMCVRARASVLPPNKAGCLLLPGFGGRFASMPSLSPEEGGMRRGRWSAGWRGDVAFHGGPARAQMWRLLLLRLLWAGWTCAEGDRCSNQPIQDRTCLCRGGGEVKLQLLTSGRKKRTPAAATGVAHGRAQERSCITECVALT